MTNILAQQHSIVLNNLTMSSLEIAKLTDKQHSHVMRDIKNMLEQLEISQSNFGGTYKDAQEKDRPCFNLNEELTLTLTSGYSIPQRHAIIKQWQSYRDNNQFKIPQTYSEALELALHQTKQLELQAPKIEVYDKLIDAKENFTMGQTAKLLGMGRNQLFAFLRVKKILMKNNLPYQKHINSNLFIVKNSVRGDKVYSQTYVTTKGQIYINKIVK